MKRWKRALVAVSAAVILASCGGGGGGVEGSNSTGFTQMVVFGDSLSDNGNLYALTRGAQPPAPYYNGRFSNGPVFTELLGYSTVPAATVSARRANLNFAFGGATAGTGSSVPSLAQQIGLYTQQGAAAASTDLFTVLAGANDLIPVLGAPTTAANPALVDPAGVAAAQAVAAGVQSLIGLGAKNIVVAGLPNLGATPRSLAAGGPGGAGANVGLRVSNAFNNELRARLGALAATSTAAGVNLTYVDLQGILDRVVLDYRALGFNNATSYGLAPTAAGGGNANGAGYVFWDDIHPTTATHAILAAIITEELNPEPVLGFGATAGNAALALTSLGARALDDRLAQLAVSNRAAKRLDAFASYNYADGTRGVDGWRPKFGFHGQLITAGVDARVSDGAFLGAAVQTGRVNASVRGGRENFSVEDGSSRLYSLWRGGPVSLMLDADYGVLRVKGIHRTTAFGGFQTNAKTDGTHWGAGLQAAWTLDGGGFTARPWGGLRTERVTLAAFRDFDVPSLNFAFDEQEAKSSAAAIGVDLGTTARLGGRDLRLDFRAAWHGELGRRTRDVSGRLADNFTQPTSIAIDDGDGDGLELGGGATLSFTRNWSATLGYTGDIRSGEKLGSRAVFSVQTGF